MDIYLDEMLALMLMVVGLYLEHPKRLLLVMALYLLLRHLSLLLLKRWIINKIRSCYWLSISIRISLMNRIYKPTR